MQNAGRRMPRRGGDDAFAACSPSSAVFKVQHPSSLGDSACGNAGAGLGCERSTAANPIVAPLPRSPSPSWAAAAEPPFSSFSSDFPLASSLERRVIQRDVPQWLATLLSSFLVADRARGEPACASASDRISPSSPSDSNCAASSLSSKLPQTFPPEDSTPSASCGVSLHCPVSSSCFSSALNSAAPSFVAHAVSPSSPYSPHASSASFSQKDQSSSSTRPRSLLSSEHASAPLSPTSAAAEAGAGEDAERRFEKFVFSSLACRATPEPPRTEENRICFAEDRAPRGKAPPKPREAEPIGRGICRRPRELKTCAAAEARPQTRGGKASDCRGGQRRGANGRSSEDGANDAAAGCMLDELAEFLNEARRREKKEEKGKEPPPVEAEAASAAPSPAGSATRHDAEEKASVFSSRALASFTRHALRLCASRAFSLEEGAEMAHPDPRATPSLPASSAAASVPTSGPSRAAVFPPRCTEEGVQLRRRLLTAATAAVRLLLARHAKAPTETREKGGSSDARASDTPHGDSTAAATLLATAEDWDLLFAAAITVVEAVYVHLIDVGAPEPLPSPVSPPSSFAPSSPSSLSSPSGRAARRPAECDSSTWRRGGSSASLALASPLSAAARSASASLPAVFCFAGERTMPPSSFFRDPIVIARVVAAGKVAAADSRLFAPDLPRRRTSACLLLKSLSHFFQEVSRLCLSSAGCSASPGSAAASSPALSAVAEKSALAGGEAVRLLQLLQPLLVTGAVYVHPAGVALPSGPTCHGVRPPGVDGDGSLSSASSRSFASFARSQPSRLCSSSVCLSSAEETDTQDERSSHSFFGNLTTGDSEGERGTVHSTKGQLRGLRESASLHAGAAAKPRAADRDGARSRGEGEETGDEAARKQRRSGAAGSRLGRKREKKKREGRQPAGADDSGKLRLLAFACSQFLVRLVPRALFRSWPLLLTCNNFRLHLPSSAPSSSLPTSLSSSSLVHAGVGAGEARMAEAERVGLGGGSSARVASHPRCSPSLRPRRDASSASGTSASSGICGRDSAERAGGLPPGLSLFSSTAGLWAIDFLLPEMSSLRAPAFILQLQQQQLWGFVARLDGDPKVRRAAMDFLVALLESSPLKAWPAGVPLEAASPCSLSSRGAAPPARGAASLPAAKAPLEVSDSFALPLVMPEATWRRLQAWKACIAPKGPARAEGRGERPPPSADDTAPRSASSASCAARLAAPPASGPVDEGMQPRESDGEGGGERSLSAHSSATSAARLSSPVSSFASQSPAPLASSFSSFFFQKRARPSFNSLSGSVLSSVRLTLLHLFALCEETAAAAAVASSAAAFSPPVAGRGAAPLRASAAAQKALAASTSVADLAELTAACMRALTRLVSALPLSVFRSGILFACLRLVAPFFLALTRALQLRRSRGSLDAAGAPSAPASAPASASPWSPPSSSSLSSAPSAAASSTDSSRQGDFYFRFVATVHQTLAPALPPASSPASALASGAALASRSLECSERCEKKERAPPHTPFALQPSLLAAAGALVTAVLAVKPTREEVLEGCLLAILPKRKLEKNPAALATAAGAAAPDAGGGESLSAARGPRGGARAPGAPEGDTGDRGDGCRPRGDGEGEGRDASLRETTDRRGGDRRGQEESRSPSQPRQVSEGEEADGEESWGLAEAIVRGLVFALQANREERPRRRAATQEDVGRAQRDDEAFKNDASETRPAAYPEGEEDEAARRRDVELFLPLVLKIAKMYPFVLLLLLLTPLRCSGARQAEGDSDASSAEKRADASRTTCGDARDQPSQAAPLAAMPPSSAESLTACGGACGVCRSAVFVLLRELLLSPCASLRGRGCQLAAGLLAASPAFSLAALRASTRPATPLSASLPPQPPPAGRRSARDAAPAGAATAESDSRRLASVRAHIVALLRGALADALELGASRRDAEVRTPARNETKNCEAARREATAAARGAGAPEEQGERVKPREGEVTDREDVDADPPGALRHAKKDTESHATLEDEASVAATALGVLAELSADDWGYLDALSLSTAQRLASLCAGLTGAASLPAASPSRSSPATCLRAGAAAAAGRVEGAESSDAEGEKTSSPVPLTPPCLVATRAAASRALGRFLQFSALALSSPSSSSSAASSAVPAAADAVSFSPAVAALPSVVPVESGELLAARREALTALSSQLTRADNLEVATAAAQSLAEAGAPARWRSSSRDPANEAEAEKEEDALWDEREAYSASPRRGGSQSDMARQRAQAGDAPAATSAQRDRGARDAEEGRSRASKEAKRAEEDESCEERLWIAALESLSSPSCAASTNEELALAALRALASISFGIDWRFFQRKERDEAEKTRASQPTHCGESRIEEAVCDEGRVLRLLHQLHVVFLVSLDSGGLSPREKELFAEAFGRKLSVKIQWNACYAIRLLYSNCSFLLLSSSLLKKLRGRLLLALASCLRVSSSYKVRVHAVAALRAIFSFALPRVRVPRRAFLCEAGAAAACAEGAAHILASVWRALAVAAESGAAKATENAGEAPAAQAKAQPAAARLSPAVLKRYREQLAHQMHLLLTESRLGEETEEALLRRRASEHASEQRGEAPERAATQLSKEGETGDGDGHGDAQDANEYGSDARGGGASGGEEERGSGEDAEENETCTEVTRDEAAEGITRCLMQIAGAGFSLPPALHALTQG
ncbi:hypothetical protein BESB_010320 [Besnoitia besnoiti]|uniref:Uncharacterized protein n=1 Tax=Besnoitia besnoiti TaxID=94643 RepID=A0A2A9MR02_BESBE|nr:hypothetical protein BESB_010320 [Besnoitia besnoiti]PFH38690.1 hypothetical protein BESB_010320 [Besnoitia besnoiti]